MRKRMIYIAIILTVFVILMTGGMIYFRGGIIKLKWMDYISIMSLLFLASVFDKYVFEMLYYQKKIIENYRTIYEKFKELHKTRYRMYFTSVDKEEIEQLSQILNKYAMTLLMLGIEIRYDEDYPQTYRIEVEEIIMDTLKLIKQIQS